MKHIKSFVVCVSFVGSKQVCKPSKIGEKSNNDVPFCLGFFGVFQSVRFCRRRFGKGEKKRERGSEGERSFALHYSSVGGSSHFSCLYESIFSLALSLFSHSV